MSDFVYRLQNVTKAYDERIVLQVEQSRNPAR